MKSANRKNILRSFVVVVLVLIAVFIGYLVYIWFDTEPVMDQLEQVTKEPPNSREMFKDDFWLLVPEADDEGNIVSYVTRITRDNLWVWGDEGTMKVHIFMKDNYPDSEPVDYQADWILKIKKTNGKWEIIEHKNIP